MSLWIRLCNHTYIHTYIHMDGGPGRQAKVCQHRRGGGLVGAHRRRHTKQERGDKIQAPQLHTPRRHTAQDSCRVEQEWDNTSRGSNNGDMTASNTASAWSKPEHTRKRSSRRRASATEVSRPGIHWQSNSRCSMWRHLCSLAATLCKSSHLFVLLASDICKCYHN